MAGQVGSDFFYRRRHNRTGTTTSARPALIFRAGDTKRDTGLKGLGSGCTYVMNGARPASGRYAAQCSKSSMSSRIKADRRPRGGSAASDVLNGNIFDIAAGPGRA